jgi:hypothetical protein
MTFTGTMTAVNTALEGLSFSATANFSGAATLTITTDDLGHHGAGGALTDSDTVNITVLGVNDAPVNTVSGPRAVSEDGLVVFSVANAKPISIADIDAGADPVQVTLSGANGVLTLRRLTGLTFSAGDGVADAAMTFIGTIANINAALDGLQFMPEANFNGTATVTITTNDQGHSGLGGPLSDTDSVTVRVLAVNDAPVNTVPGPQTVNEDAALVFNPAAGNAISISDVDAATGALRLSLAATNGVLSLAGTTGLTFTLGDGAADSAMTFTGTLANINNALNGLSFLPTAEYSGAASLTVTTNDQGNTGGGALSDTDTVNITVNAVNDAPVNHLPAAASVDEDGSVRFSNADGNAISISDVDAGSGAMQVSLSVTNGVLTLSGVAGLTFTLGDGAADAAMTFTGSLTAINTALDGLSFAPTAGYFGAATLTIAANDQGHSGGPAQSDTDNLAITVTPVNDAPVNTLPGDQTTDEDTPVVFASAAGNAISIADPDAGANPVQVSLTAMSGVISLATVAGLSFTLGDGAADAALTFTGTMTDINAALDGLSFAPTADYSGSASLTIVTNDQGHAGGGPLSDTDTVNITVNPVNDAPMNHMPAATTVDEDATLVFSSGNGNAISISDVDAGADPVQVSLSITNGLLTLSGAAGLTFTVGDGAADAAMTFTGALTDINAALEGLSFAPLANYYGAAVFTLTASDQGSMGAGGPLSDTDAINITVAPVNDAPVNTVCGPRFVSEDTMVVFSVANTKPISIADLDAGANPVQVTLTGGNGALTLRRLTGLTFSLGDGVADSAMTFTGTMTNINNALDGLQFMPTANYTGSASVTIATNDLSATGSGGPLSDTDSVNITVMAINDAPVNNLPAAQTVNEDAALVLSSAHGNALSISDVDAGASPVRLSLSATNGALTLAGTAGLTFAVGDGAADAAMTFTGTLANINAALNGLSFAPTAEYSGAASIVITTNDQGATGSGGALSDTDTLTITVNPVNDAPVNTLPASRTVSEDSVVIFSAANGKPMSIADIDAGANPVQVSLTGANGVVTLAGTTGLTFSAGDGLGDAAMTFTGSLANINTALDGMFFRPTANYNGPASVTITTNDLGNSGGPAQSDTDTVAITVLSINDAPVNTIPVSRAVSEDGLVVFSTANGKPISIADADAGSSPMRVTLSVTNGVLTLARTTGLTFTTGDGASDPAMTFTGTITNINAALNGLVFTPTANFNGNATLTIATNDQGATGSGGALSDTDTCTIRVLAVNDNPVAGTDNVSYIQDQAKTFAALANDTDVDGDALSIASFTQPAHGAVVKNADNTFTYTPNPGYAGNDGFTYSISDGQGGSATGQVNLSLAVPLSAAAAGPGAEAQGQLTAADLAAIASQAATQWQAGLNLAGLDIQVADLPGLLLGQTVGHTIILDVNAAGHGWFIDPTPTDNSEFTGHDGAFAALASGLASGRMDLLTAMAHELGHVLGLEHAAAGLMAPTLAEGARRLPPGFSAPAQAAPVVPEAPRPAPASAAARQVMVFDESQGKLLRPGLQGRLATPHDLSFNLTPGEGADSASPEEHDAWIMAVRPRKLQG